MLCTIEIVRNVSSTNFIQSVSIFVGSKTNLNLIHNLIPKSSCQNFYVSYKVIESRSDTYT